MAKDSLSQPSGSSSSTTDVSQGTCTETAPQMPPLSLNHMPPPHSIMKNQLRSSPSGTCTYSSVSQPSSWPSAMPPLTWMTGAFLGRYSASASLMITSSPAWPMCGSLSKRSKLSERPRKCANSGWRPHKRTRGSVACNAFWTMTSLRGAVGKRRPSLNVVVCSRAGGNVTGSWDQRHLMDRGKFWNQPLMGSVFACDFTDGLLLDRLMALRAVESVPRGCVD